MSPAFVSYVLDPAERAARTFVQQFTMLLLAAPAAGLVLQQNWLLAADSALFAAVVSLITSILTFKVPPQRADVDLALRVIKTGLQSFVGTLVAGHVLSISGADWKGALGVAFPVALTAFLTGLAALGVANTAGASLLPAGVTAAVPDDALPEEDVSGMFPAYSPDSDAVAIDDDHPDLGEVPAAKHSVEGQDPTPA